MTSASYTHNQTRLVGLDLIRFISIIAIVVFHTNEIIFWQDTHPLSQSSIPVYRAFLSLSQALPYSGFTVIAISFFLLGLSGFKFLIRLAVFLMLGILILAGAQGSPPFLNFYWEWDIYAYLLVSVLAVQVLSKFKKLHIWGVAVFFAMTWIPFWQFPLAISDTLKTSLIGICPPEGIGSWPLLPWIAWPCLFYCLGSIYKFNKTASVKLQSITKTELIVWGLLLGFSLPLLPSTYGNPIGPHFYCHTHRQSPPLFWSHYIWILFFLRLSLVKEINSKLAKISLVRFIANLAWSQKFGLSYLTHLILLAIGAQATTLFFEVPLLFDIYFISIIPITEILVRLFTKIKVPFNSSKT